MDYWIVIIEIAKGIAILLGIFVTLFTLKAHYLSIFNPNKKRVEDLKFSTSLELLKSIHNHKFLCIYELHSPLENKINFNALSDLISSINGPISNPFLPEGIREAGQEFIATILKESNFLTMAFSNEGSSTASKEVIFLNRQEIFEKHKILHERLTTELKVKKYKFNYLFKEAHK
jgi:hypothetical protein